MLRKKFCNCVCVLLWCKAFRYFMVVQSCLLSLVKTKEYLPKRDDSVYNSKIVENCLNTSNGLNPDESLYVKETLELYELKGHTFITSTKNWKKIDTLLPHPHGPKTESGHAYCSSQKRLVNKDHNWKFSFTKPFKNWQKCSFYRPTAKHCSPQHLSQKSIFTTNVSISLPSIITINTNLFSTFTAEGFTETGPFIHSRRGVFHNR